MMAQLLPELRLALRGLLRQPGHALGVVLTLALGIAVCAAMYSVVHGVVLKGLDYPEPERLRVLGAQDLSAGGEGMLAGAEAERLAELGAVESAGYFLWGGATHTGGERPRMLTLILTGGEFFRTLGVQPQLGRWLTAGDANRDSGVVLSHQLWQDLYGGDPGIIGKPFQVDWIQSTVVGVMPPGFGYPVDGIDLWIGYDVAQLRAQPPLFENARFLKGIARLKPGVDEASLSAELAAFSQRLAGEHAPLRDWRLAATPMLDDEIGPVRPVLLALLLIAALALGVACANVVNLVLLRALARAQELAVHQALGASRGRLARRVFIETFALGALATGLGVLGAELALQGFVGLADSDLPRVDEIQLDAAGLLSVVAIGLAASLLAALLPAWRLLRADPARGLGGASGRVLAARGGVSRALPIAACAVSVGGLAAALLLAGSVRHLEQVPLGYTPEPVLMLQLFREPDPGRGAFNRALIEQLQAVPGVASAASLSSGPLSPLGSIPIDVQVLGRDAQEALRPRVRTASGPVQEVLGLGLRSGRWLESGDHADAEPVAVVNRAFAERVFGTQDPLGQRISLPPFGEAGPRKEFRIVGVMEDARLDTLAAPAEPEVWVPDAQYWVSSVALLLRAQAEPGALLKPAQEAIWSLHPNLGIYSTQRVAALRDRQLATPRFFARNAGAFAVLALLLAAIGVHSVVAYQMTRRQREFALRLALGSAPRALALRVLRAGLALGLPAAALGAGLGLLFGQVLRSVVVGVDGWLWSMPALAAALLLAVVVAASLRSMQRALRVQPMQALRAE